MTDTVAADAPPTQPAKVDAETLTLRSRPIRAIRFRRGVIIGMAALGSTSLMGVAWLALKPQVFTHVAQDSDLSQPLAKAAPEALNGLPGSYAVVPKLGPPLPGDLGRPFLRAQQREEMAAALNDAEPVAAARQQHITDLKAARESGLMAGSRAGVGTASPPTDLDDLGEPTAGQAESSASASRPAPPPEEGASRRPASANEKAPPNSLLAGSVIAASLITGLNSDLPGLVTAQVTQNVFDTVTGNTLLVPQGARLIGKYESAVAFGQSRALIIWQRLVLPDGHSLSLDDMPATDVAGYSGLADRVDAHTGQLLKGVAIATLLGVGSELSISGDSDLIASIRESVQDNTSRAGDRITQRNLDVKPTITIRPGTPVRLLVTRDLALAPWHSGVR